ncbi:MAG: 30S ribosomal protein S16, partial [Gemmatimonadota bacterium]|nr:30S ribosomal protein S16 [Gemmatimonadota bacterium]
MAVKLRLARHGNRKRPFYRVVVAESAHRRDGRFIDMVGTYDPLKKPAVIEVKADKVLHWLSVGAQPSPTVRSILAKTGVWAHWRAVQDGSAQLSDMTGRVDGTLERARDDRPSKKVVAKLESAEAEAVEAAAAEETAADEAPAAEEEAPAAEETAAAEEAP